MVTKVRGASSQDFTSRTAMKAYDAPVDSVLYLNEGGRSGQFVRRAGSPPVSDPEEGVYIIADAGGYDERDFAGSVNAAWFGVVGDGSTEDSGAFSAAEAYAGGVGKAVFVPTPASSYEVNATGFSEIFYSDTYVEITGTNDLYVFNYSGNKERIPFVYPAGMAGNHDSLPAVYSQGGRYYADIDPRAEKPVRANTYYVDPYTGDDGNVGDEANPFKSLAFALGVSGDNEIILTPGYYYYEDGWKGVDPARGVNVVCRDGVAYLSTDAYPRPWVEEPTAPGSWRTPITYNGETLVSANCRLIIPGTATDTARGYILPTEGAGNIFSGSVGRVFDSGSGDIIVRLPNDLNPNDDLVIARVEKNIESSLPSTGTIYLENITGIYGDPNVALINTLGDSSIICVNCHFDYGRAGDSLILRGSGKALMYECSCSGAFEDGFNYFASTASTFDIVEIDCWSRNNGKTTSGTNNGSTAHSGCRIMRLNCDHSLNQDRNIHDVGGNALSLNIGCKAVLSRNGAEGIQVGIDGGSSPATMWLVGCESDVTTVALNSTMYIAENNALGTFENNGTILPYRD